ncbi:MAG: Clp1/GlmU family protein [Deltaproteobacteria bacterium]|nr:Clp1/GlmU family protein [Deltaproteobacteria bacterium]
MNRQSQEIFPFLKNLDIPPEWDEAAARFVKTGRTCMVIGGPDTGKSTLSRYLIYRAFAAGKPAALVDLDVGQSHLGPPAALGLALFPPRFPGDDSLFPDGLYFIGQTSPVGAVLEVTVGCRTLADQALDQGVRHIVVNTSGLVQGPAAFRLKPAQAELLRPPLILGLARERELDCLLQAMGTRDGREACVLPVSALSTRKSMEARRAYREARFREYFARARRRSLPLKKISWRGVPLSQGRPLEPEEIERYAEILKTPVLLGEADGRRVVLLLEEMTAECHHRAAGEEKLVFLTWQSFALRLVGLLDGQCRTMGLGLLLPGPWNGRSVTVLTPVAAQAAPQVRFLHVGKLRLSPDGRELG